MQDYLNQQKNTQEIEDTSSIKEKINEIDNYVSHNKHKTNFNIDVEQQFSDFNKKYPSLFKKLINQDCDRKQLDFVLNRLEEVRVGSKTQYDASVEVGQVLVDNYVKPKLAEKGKSTE